MYNLPLAQWERGRPFSGMKSFILKMPRIEVKVKKKIILFNFRPHLPALSSRPLRLERYYAPSPGGERGGG